jgi:hypothetical protein
VLVVYSIVRPHRLVCSNQSVEEQQMHVGLKTGDRGPEVARLHVALLAAGYEIDAGERERQEFGRSTTAALRTLRRDRGLPERRERERGEYDRDETERGGRQRGERRRGESRRAGRGEGEREENEGDEDEREHEEHEHEEIDEDVLVVLVEIEVTGGGPTPPSPPTPGPPPGQGSVTGSLVDQDGAPVAGTTVKLLSMTLKGSQALGETSTGKDGGFAFTYARPKPLNLQAQALDDVNEVIAASKTIFAAPATVEINLTTAPNGVVRALSLFTTLRAAVTGALDGEALGDLQENASVHQVQFLAQAIGRPFAQVASLYIAHKLGQQHKLNDETLFGIFTEGVPPNLDAALSTLPTNGIDVAFMAQILAAVLSHAQTLLASALTTATEDNVLPASYAELQSSELDKLAALRVVNTGAAPYIRGKTPLSSLLAAGQVSSAVQTAFVEAFAANNGALGPTWRALRANSTLSKTDLASLDTLLNAGELLTGNLPLVTDTLTRLASGSLASLGDLALMDQADWEARIQQVDPNATSIPQVLPNDTAADRIARFAKSLAGRFAARYPTTAFRGALMKATNSPFRQSEALVSFLAENSAFNLHATSIDKYLASNDHSLAAPAVAELKTAQRLHRIAPYPPHIEALYSARYASAQSVYFTGRAKFLKKMSGPLGASHAQQIYASAQMTYASSLVMAGRYNGSFNAGTPAAMSSPPPDPALLTNLPDLQALFGSMDYFQCDDCQSIYSPAAYLVDLLQYLIQFDAQLTITDATNANPIVVTTALDHGLATGASVTITRVAGDTAANGTFTITVTSPTTFSLNGSAGNGAYTGGGQVAASGMTVETARDALFLRRPEIQYVGLSCNNTNIVIPYIDLANEILERAVAGVAPPNTPIETTERAAVPQQTQPAVAKTAYDATGAALFPLTLPFDQAFARTTAYLAGLGGGREALLQLFKTALAAGAIAEAGLGLNQAMAAIITAVDSVSPWDRWGLAQNPAVVIDPKTREPYSPNPADWIAALNKAPFLMAETGLTLQQVLQLFEAAWVTRGAVTLEMGTVTENGVTVLSADTDLIAFTGLDSDVLDRINRFLRLLTASGLQMWELDWALDAAVGGVVDESFLVFLSGAIAVAGKLGLPLQEALTFWGPLGTRDVVSHLGDEDVVVPSTYTNVFLNPAVAANSGNVFGVLADATITGATNANPIVITTAAPHGFATGMVVTISEVTGNTAANGAHTITAGLGPTTFSLDGVAGNGAWTGGGFAAGPIATPPPSILPSGPQPTAQQIAITAALGLDAQDVEAIIDDSGADPVLSLETLGALLRYQRLATSLSLTVSDLISWIQLTGQKPFAANPADTQEFMRRLGVLQGVSLTLADLEYLLCGQSASQSALAFTQTQATTTLQTIRDSAATATAAAGLALTVVTPSAPIAATTAKPHGLATGASVLVTGVNGPAGANGTHTVTVTSPTAFTLDGTSDATAWTGGGAVVTAPAALSTAIQASVVAALAAATGASPTVLTAAAAAKPALTPGFDTITALLAQPTVDPTQFPYLMVAIVQAAMAAALYTALGCTADFFAFVIANAASYGLLDPTSLPVSPTQTTPYAKFEALLQALALQKRQSARTPKLSDVLGAWAGAGGLPPDVATAVGGPTLTVTGAANSPIQITTATSHGLHEGDQVTISGVQGNTAANGSFTVSIQGQPPNAFLLTGTSSSGAYVAGGTVVSLSAPAVAFALNTAITDVMAIATELGAKTPSLADATRAGTLADMTLLTAIAAALDVARVGKISGATLVQLVAAAPDDTTAAAAMGAFQARYPQSAWLNAVKPVEDNLRQARRDALVAWLLGPGATSNPGAWFLTTNDIYNYYLIDPEMCACGQTTRLLQPSLAIQQFVQQCFLNLTFGAVVDTTNTNWQEWSWRQQYRLWQANREVFLYPENYVLPELRTNASSFFTDLENDIAQSNGQEAAVEAALENYMRKLVGVSRLVVVALYNEVGRASDRATVLHVFARTSGTPPQWYYRTRTTPAPAAGTSPVGAWSAWSLMNLDILTDHLMPVVWDGRLYLFWPTFKLISEKARDSSVPSGGGGSSSTAQKFTAVQIAYSEFSAGQWQAKRTYDQKMYFDTEDPDIAFTFKAMPNPDLSLSINVYWGTNIYGADDPTAQYQDEFSFFVAHGTLLYPDAKLKVQQSNDAWDDIIPDASLVDTSQEPSYLTIQTADLQVNSSGSLVLPTPTGYSFSGQDLVPNYFWTPPSPNAAPVYVMTSVTPSGGAGSVELLATAVNPAVVAPHQEVVFDSSIPFVVYDEKRTWLVDPFYYTVSSSAQPAPNSRTAAERSTGYRFSTFYHPYARTFLRELETKGIPAMMNRKLQLNPAQVSGRSAVNFASIYNPQSWVAKPYPGVVQAQPGEIGGADPGESWLDFDPGSGGAYSLYNWEIFYHIPMYLATQLMQNQQLTDAMTWLEYIFDPTDDSGGPTPQRYWEMAPFNQMTGPDWANQQIETLLTDLSIDRQQGLPDPAMLNAITAWMNDPYDPHMVASTRISAYGKATVMKLLDVILALGDAAYAIYTAENVSIAEQYYVLGSMLLGDAPSESRLPTQQQTAPPTYASLSSLDAFSNTLVPVENLIIAPEPPQSLVQGLGQGPNQAPSLPALPSVGETLLFCIPPNSKLLGYWGAFAQRLYNIRHCLNLQGVAQPLPLYAPPINPLQLIEAKRSGAGGAMGALAPAPVYRFATYLQKAVDLTNDVRAFGEKLLAALEKQDAEALAALRATQELAIQTALLDVKTQQVTEATDQITVLQNQQAAALIRQQFYSSQDFMNAAEKAALGLQAGALIANGVAMVLDLTAGIAYATPKVTAGAAGFGGSPALTVTFGGENIGNASTKAASVSRTIAGILSEGASMAATIGGYMHRQDEWNLQASLAQADMTQFASQIVVANDRLTAANTEVTIQNTQIANAQSISDFLTNKYTNTQLYSWMVTQLTAVYTQAYQLAISLALQAQNAYAYELGRPDDQFIQPSYWTSQYKGLTAGDGLLFDLKRMESQFLGNNLRELEITRSISLALTQPAAFLLLLQTGSCTFYLDEALFDHDYPGHYFRRLRSAAVTIPCVTGPYTGVHASLALNQAVVRTIAPSSPYDPVGLANPPLNFPDGVFVSPPQAAAPIIVTSTAMNDPGLFEVNLHDERWLPFEGQGAVSTWTLMLDPRDNDFDLSTVTDVVLHVRYTARPGGDAEMVRKALKPLNARSILVSAKNTFSNAFYAFFNPNDPSATSQTLAVPLIDTVFPFANLGAPKIASAQMVFALAPSLASKMSGMSVDGTCQPAAAASAAISFTPVAAVQEDGVTAVTALTADLTLPAAPDAFTVTVPLSGVTGPLTKTVGGQTLLDPTLFEDIFLVLTYDLG